MSKRHNTRLVRGRNLADCIKIARQLGSKVEPVTGTGDVRFTHPSMLKPVNVNGRRKDAPRKLTGWINELLSVLHENAVAQNGLRNAAD